MLESERANEYASVKPSEGRRGDTDKIPKVAPPVEASTQTQLRLQTKEIPIVKTLVTEDESPLPEVPPLPRTGDHKAIKLGDNGSKNVPEE
jgi:hypothetical protein